MPGRIFVNYRRDDVPGDARGVRDGLAAKFGKANVFMDVDNLLVGQRFDVELAKALDACDMLIAVIGPRWMDLLKDRTASGERDYVREEIAAALARKITVIPVRVGREGSMPALPRASDLPEDIRDLVLHQKLDVAHERFGRDITELVEGIVAVRRSMSPRRPSVAGSVPWGWVGATAASVLAIAYFGAYQLGVPVWVPWSPGPPPLQPTKEQLEAAARQSVLREQEAKRIADQKAANDAAEAKKKADEAERQRVAAAQAKAEDDRKRAEADAKQKAEEFARAEAKRVADAEATKKAEEKKLADQILARVKAMDAPLWRQRDPVQALTPGSGQSARDLGADGLPCPMCPEMVVVPSGSFMMGSAANEVGRSDDEGPQRSIKTGQTFAVGKFEVTFDEWDACVAAKGCQHKPETSWGRGRQPVMNVSWNDAKEYVTWMSRKTGKTYRLLSEAEWEYAARAKTVTRFSFGDDDAQLGTYAWYNSNAGSRTHPVGEKSPNAFGLYDMHGNLWEWCEDTKQPNYRGAPTDGSAWVVGISSSRVLRGGSWVSNPYNLRSALRYDYLPDGRNISIGFRVARTL